MPRKYQVIFIRALYLMLDIAFIQFSFYLAASIRQETLPFPVTFTSVMVGPGNPFKFVFLFWMLAILLFNYLHNLYQTRRELLESVEIWEVIKSAFFGAFVTVFLAYLLRIEEFPRSVYLISIVFISFYLSLWRVLKKYAVEYLVVRGYNNFNALIVGAGKVGQTLEEEIHKRRELGIKVVGYLDDFKSTKEIASETPVLGTISDFPKIAKREFINKVFITIHHDSRVFMKLLEDAKDLGVAVRVIPQGFNLITSEFTKYNIGIIPILEYSDELLHRQTGKRVFDLVLATLVLAVIWPVFIILPILIKLDSPGPVYYASKRYGRKGRIFYMYKFRSMISDADAQLRKLKEQNEVDGPIFKIRNDPRITKFGAFLRKYSLDELPQIFNVLKGDMSMVGPRPLPIEQVEREDFRQLKRLDIRPGITGLWQIRGRSDLPFQRLVRWDIWYINNWSFELDLYILMQTVPAVLGAKGAY